MWARRAENKRVLGRGMGAPKTTPSKQERLIEGWKDSVIERKRARKDNRGRGAKVRLKAKGYSGAPARRGGGEPPQN